MVNKGTILMQKYEIGRLLGKGTFAKVYHARNLKTTQSVAIKVIDKEKVLRVGLMEQIKREISVMRLVRHPHVVQLYEVMATKTKIYFVIEYVKGGELFNKIAKGKLKEDEARNYFQQLISAVDYCHSRGVYHRDLKPENLLLDEDGNLKISDFGLSAFAESKRQDGLLHTTCGTPAYVAPDVISRRGYDGTKADVWSCGVVLFVLLAGYLPFHDPNLMEMYRKIGKGQFKCPNGMSHEVKKLLTQILDPNPCTRISIGKIMRNSWFRKGLDVQPKKTDAEAEETTSLVDVDAALKSLDATVEEGAQEKRRISNLNADVDAAFKSLDVTVEEGAQEKRRLSNLNAFDIISLSAGFDLSGLFEEKDQKKEVRFTSKLAASSILSKLEDIAKRLKLKVKKKDGGVLKMEAAKAGRKGVIAVDAEIFEVTPNFHLVEMKKSNGDTLEYQKLLKEDIRPALKDIVWAWQGETQYLQHEQVQQPPAPSLHPLPLSPVLC